MAGGGPSRGRARCSTCAANKPTWAGRCRTGGFPLRGRGGVVGGGGGVRGGGAGPTAGGPGAAAGVTEGGGSSPTIRYAAAIDTVVCSEGHVVRARVCVASALHPHPLCVRYVRQKVIVPRSMFVSPFSTCPRCRGDHGNFAGHIAPPQSAGAGGRCGRTGPELGSCAGLANP